jgi:quinoprotein glucose dehydrogenase
MSSLALERTAPVGWAVWIAIILFIPIGLFLLGGGFWLIALGGSWYYALTGAAVLGSAYLMWRGSMLGIWLYVAMLIGTVIWSVAEIGFDFWGLLPRIAGPAVLGLWLCLPAVWRNLK